MTMKDVLYSSLKSQGGTIDEAAIRHKCIKGIPLNRDALFYIICYKSIVSSTGQWSEPITSVCILAPSSLSLSLSDTQK